MYVPQHFAAPDDDAVHDLLRHHGAADLVTSTSRGLLATLLPFVHDPDEDGPGGCSGTSRATTTSGASRPVGEALVIVRGPDAYVSPSWYATKAEHGRVVPTWNYVTAHVYGRLVVHDDAAWVESLVRRLTAKHEAQRPAVVGRRRTCRPSSPGSCAPSSASSCEISRIEAKWKLSQNRSAADVDGVVAGLAAEQDAAAADVAAAMGAD